MQNFWVDDYQTKKVSKISKKKAKIAQKYFLLHWITPTTL